MASRQVGGALGKLGRQLGRKVAENMHGVGLGQLRRWCAWQEKMR